MKKQHASYADCAAFEFCATIQGLFGKNWYKYKKYREALEFVRSNG
jgi:hypothetical protein